MQGRYFFLLGMCKVATRYFTSTQRSWMPFLISRLWNQGVDVNAAIDGRLPLHYASDYGQLEVLQYLISKVKNWLWQFTTCSLCRTIKNGKKLHKNCLGGKHWLRRQAWHLPPAGGHLGGAHLLCQVPRREGIQLHTPVGHHPHFREPPSRAQRLMALRTWRRQRRRRSKPCWDNPPTTTSTSDVGIVVCPLWYCSSFPKYWFLPPMPEFDSLIWLEACNGQCSILIHLLPFYPDIYRFVEQLGYPVQIVSTAGIVFWCNCNNKLLIDHYQRINNKFSKSITWVEWEGGIANSL